MKQTPFIPALIVMSLLCAVSLADDGRQQSTPAGENTVCTQLWFEQPAAEFHQSLVLGNGRIGAMVFGGVDEERIVLNESSVWSGSSADVLIEGGYKALPEIRRLLAEEKFGEAEKLVKQHFDAQEPPAHGKQTGVFGRYQTLGNLRLKFSGNTNAVAGYRRELDLASALGSVSYRRGAAGFQREHFVSAPDEVFVSRLTGPVSFTVSLDRPERFKTVAVGDRELLMTGTLDDGKGGKGVTYAGRLRVLNTGGTVKATGNTLAVDGAKEVVLLFAAATDYRGFAGRQLADPVAATTADLDKAAKKTFEQLRAAQKADHEKWFNRVTLNLPATTNSGLATPQRLAGYRSGAPDPALAALGFNFGRYLLISSSRPGGFPANLQGIWAEEVNTMWNADWHFNINVQMNYWPATVCNLAELQQPLHQLIAMLAESGKATAKAYFNARGWLAYLNTNPWGYTAPHGKGAGIYMGGPAWLCEHLWEQYTFTQDREFLKWAYPLMKASAEFYLDTLWEEPEHKWLVTGPSSSPECGFKGRDGKTHSVTLGPTIDMQQLRELFGNTARAARILGVDDDLQRELISKRARLAPNQIGPDGRLQEWLKPYPYNDPQHRHTSPLYGLHPYYEITPTGTPELAQAARKLLEQRGLGDSMGWPNAWKVNLWARLNDSDKAHFFVKTLLSGNSFDNLLSRLRPDGARGLFQIDANFGLTSGIAQMLLQSHPDNGDIDAQPVIRLLPALPKEWPTGKVTGLRARGGFTVDIEWQDGKVTNYRITSPDPQTVKVRVNGEERTEKTQKENRL